MHADHVNHHQREIQFPRVFFPFVCTQSNTHTALIAVQDVGLDRYFGKREKRRFDQVEGRSASEGQETTKRNPKLISAAQSERGANSQRSNIIRRGLADPSIGQYDPTSAINRWLNQSKRARRPTYRYWPTDMDMIIATNDGQCDLSEN